MCHWLTQNWIYDNDDVMTHESFKATLFIVLSYFGVIQ